MTNEDFGEGRSIKYFNFLFKFFIPMVVIGQLVVLSQNYKAFVSYYRSDSALYFSVWGNIVLIITLLINLFINVYLISLVSQKKRVEFAKWFLWRFVIDYIGFIFTSSFYVTQFPSLSAEINAEIASTTIASSILFIPHMVYIIKRLPKAPITQTSPIVKLDQANQNDNFSSPKNKVSLSVCNECGAQIKPEYSYCKVCGNHLKRED